MIVSRILYALLRAVPVPGLASPFRLACFLAGIGLLALIWAGPLLGAWRESFAAHMLAHMGVIGLAAPLLAIGLAGRVRGEPHPAAPEHHFLGSLPVIASLVEFVVVWGWHAPAARGWAEASGLVRALEQASFLGAGLFLWVACLAAGGSRSSVHRAAGAFGLFVTTIHMTMLGALLALSPRPLYGLSDVTCFGLTLTAAADQQLGAVSMLFVGAVVYLAGAVSLLAGLLASDEEGQDGCAPERSVGTKAGVRWFGG